MKQFTFLLALLVFALASDSHESQTSDTYIQRVIKRIEGVINHTIIENKENNHRAQEEYANEILEGRIERQKRSTESSSTYSKLTRRERSIMPYNSFFKINLVSFHNPHGSRHKRATFNSTSTTWPHHIPYKFDNSTYPDVFSQEMKAKIKRIMVDIMEHVCVVWTEEEDFDPANNTEYETNAYLNFIAQEGNICSAFLGQGSGTSARNIKPCTSYYTIVHELLHTLGVLHDQQADSSDGHLTSNLDNVYHNYVGGTYRRYDDERVFTEEFDSTGIMMYSRRSFSKNGLDVMMAVTEDEFSLDNERRVSLANVYAELNKVYRCRERNCPEIVDCGNGYYTKVKGKCQCVCPAGFDSTTSCTELDNENSGPQEWPDTKFSLYAADIGECPDGFSQAQIDITGTRAPRFYREPFYKTGNAVNYHMCSRNASGSNSMTSFPMGDYCVVKGHGVACDAGFEEGGFNVTSTENVTSSGDYGDWEIVERKVNMKFCCRKDKEWYYPIELPRQAPFTLISNRGKCPIVKGMRFALGRILMFVNNPTVYGKHPQKWKRSIYLVHSFCTYWGGTYGCNKQISLDNNTRSQIIETPGFETNSRGKNRHCLYSFSAPEGARIQVKFDTFDIEYDDLFNVRQFNKWNRPMFRYEHHFKREFITEKNFLFIEWWAGRSDSSHRGVNFTATVLLPEENCYDISTRGRSYIGNKAVSEDFEECVQWKDAVNCSDFPFNNAEAFHLITNENYCRNVGHRMDRPWCYVSVDRGSCRKAYCDVCNFLDTSDVLHNCQALKDADPTFCSSALQRSKCGTTCQLDLSPELPYDEAMCETPSVPYGGIPTEPLKSSYNLGETVSFSCTLRDINEPPTEIECTFNGWPHLNAACTECPYDSIPVEGDNRCFMYDPQLRFVDFASSHCADKGGRLFEIRDQQDHTFIRTFKQTSFVPNAFGSSWINAWKNSDGAWMLYDNHTKLAPYLAWASDYDLFPKDYACAVMRMEYIQLNAGQFIPTDCNLALSRTFCEYPRLDADVCFDKHNLCDLTIAEDPYFCTRPESYQSSVHYCQRSCGDCVSGTVKCHETSGDDNNYHRVTASSLVNPGDVMIFECDPGFYHVTGDLTRTCGPDGDFFGFEPSCQNVTYDPITVGLSGVQKRWNVLPIKKAFLLDVDGFRIPRDSQITHWHFYGKGRGNVSFLVYRKDPSTDMMDLVGYNNVSVSELGMKWTVFVPIADQIVVKADDVFGVFTTDGDIAATPCDRSLVKLMNLKVEKAKSITALTSQSARAFGVSNCYFPSIAITLK